MEERTINGIKTIFMYAKADIDVSRVINKLNINEKKIGLVSTIQYFNQLERVKELLEKKGKEVLIGGQVIGCNASNAVKIKDKIECLVYVGSGEFHPLEVIEETKISNVYIANPESEVITKISKDQLELLEKKKRGKINKFLNAKKIGILVSNKPGQENLRSALVISKKLKQENYVFLDNEFDFEKYENFNDIDFWINTACIRIEHSKVLSLKDIIPYL